MSVWICLAVGIVITVGSLAFMRQLFTFLHTPEDLMTETLQYFGTILAGTTITIFNNLAMTLCVLSETAGCLWLNDNFRHC